MKQQATKQKFTSTKAPKKKKVISENTICAISTPTGNGAIAIIRLSGKKSIEICNKIFTPKNKKTNILKAKPNTIHFGNIVYKKNIIDEVLVSIFKLPKSYTGEDSVEISCHGSIFIQQRIIEILLINGATLAKPGEFTQRAFFNGKLDLAQAEAVADLISSENEAEHRLAIQQIRGGFSETLNKLRNSLIHFVSLIELENDFAEEDIQFADRKQLNQIIFDVDKLVSKLIESFSYGNVIKNGVPVAIVGKPNSGKSTLLNTLINENRAIVSEIAGTTRDTIEETLNINGIKFRFIDTAGLRETSDEIEKIGVEKAISKINNSTIYIFLFDINTNTPNDVENEINNLNNNIPRLIIANKTDISKKEKIQEFENSNLNCLFISAKNTENTEVLKQELFNFITKTANPNDIVVTNSRHLESLLEIKKALNETKEGIINQYPTDLIALDIRNAIFHIGNITGEVSNNEVLGNIFKNFCIGK